MLPTICLNMIVTQEDAFYLHTSLEAIKPYISHWVIAEDGCSEATIQRIEQTLDGIAGEVVSIEAQYKAEIRNSLIEYSKSFAEYLLFIEPWLEIRQDKVFGTAKEFVIDSAKDAYYIYEKSSIERAEIRLVKSNLNWRYIGASNEFIICDSPTNNGHFDSIHTHSHLSGLHKEQHYQKSIDTLEAHLKVHPDDSHALFSKGYFHSQLNQADKAIEYFEAYLESEQHWDNEWKWFALYMKAKILELSKNEPKVIINAYLNAYQFRPRRAEPLVDLARYYRLKKMPEMAYLYSHQAYLIEKPKDETFVLKPETYTWQIPTEFAINAQQMGQDGLAIQANNKALLEGSPSRNLRDSLLQSRRKSIDIVQSKKLVTKPKNVLNRIRLVIPFKNAGEYVKGCVESLKTQNYENFVATFVDDCSTDGSPDYVPGDDPRFELIKNKEWQGALRNRMKVILDSDPHDIMLWLDGDDQLAHDGVLETINQTYNQTDCWLTYGQYISTKGNIGFARPYTDQNDLMAEQEIGNMRFPMHPITHRAGLFQRIQQFNPSYTCFKDNEGNWLEFASDAVLARPLFDLAGYDRIYYFDDALYLYNEGHVNAESIANKREQIATCRMTTNRVRCPKVDYYAIPNT